MKTFVLFCCTVISGVGFASGGLVDETMWKGIAGEFGCNTTLETEDAKITDAEKYFEWFINHREELQLEEEVGTAPVISGVKIHAMFTWRVEDPKNPAVEDYFQVFIAENGAHPSETEVNGLEGCVYIETNEMYSGNTTIHLVNAIKELKQNNTTAFIEPPKKVIIHYKLEKIGPYGNPGQQELRICIQLVVTE